MITLLLLMMFAQPALPTGDQVRCWLDTNSGSVRCVNSDGRNIPASPALGVFFRPVWEPDRAQFPDLSMTPGAVRTSDRAAICTLRSTKDVRSVKQSQKKAIYREYRTAPGQGICQLREHVTKKGRKIYEGCEVDHLISLELGGANDTTNLWPQPYHPRPGAHEKDWLENRLHKEICAGRISVREAQEGIVKDWWKLYLKYKGH